MEGKEEQKEHYDQCIIGFSEIEGRVIYSLDKLIEKKMRDEQCSRDDAYEWFLYNVNDAYPYPILI